jgi:hypothetical protein
MNEKTIMNYDIMIKDKLPPFSKSPFGGFRGLFGRFGLLFLLLPALLTAQEYHTLIPRDYPYSQETAEMNALQQYEQTHPPRSHRPEPAPADREAFFGARVVRTATLLATSCRERRQPVRIIIYGQSIAGSQVLSEELDIRLRQKFPHADIHLENRSIGGFGGDRLLRTAVHDLYDARPDLIIFHVYGGEAHGELEQLFANLRRYTTAEVLLMNHHLDRSSKAIHETSFNYLRYIANKYHCELVDISTEWMRYLADHHLETADLLRDGVHLNRHGNRLAAQFIIRHLQYNSLFPNDWMNTVQTAFVRSAYDQGPADAFTFTGEPWKIISGVPAGDTPQSALRYTFHGNRADLIAGQLPDSLKTGSARIYIDGKPVSSHPGLYTITRPSMSPEFWFPAIMRIGYRKPLVEETWTLHVDRANTDSTVFYFSVKGSKTGFDGSGNTAEPFVSKSGRVVIDPSDYMFFKVKAPVPPGFEVHWSVLPLYLEVYRTPVITDRTKVEKTTVVQGLENGLHTLEIIPNGDGPVPVEAIEIHRPPLQ